MAENPRDRPPYGTGSLSPEEMLCFDVYSLQQAFGRVYKPILEPLGLTYPQYLVMMVLWDEAPVTVGRIRTRLGLETSTITPLIKRLEAAGQLTRHRDTVDERRVLVDLTQRGRSMERDAIPIPACVEQATGLSDQEIQDLRMTLTRVRAALNEEATGKN